MKKTTWMFFVLVAALGMLAGCGGRRAQQPTIQIVEQERACGEQWVHMPMLINFPTGGTEIDHQNRTILEEMVRTASVRPDIRRVRVEGHTDSCGSEMNNMALSQNRAIAIAGELVTMGVPQEAIDTIGYGSTQPIADESCGRSTRISENTNRRVEFSLLVCR
jgi:outer membrane protein OmpA-like peptidoglycan-associated protein